MRLLSIFLRMLRLRVTLTLLIFYAIGLAWSGSLQVLRLNFLCGALAIIFAYGSATSFNDLADVAIDKINLKGARDRLLANKKASSGDILTVAIISALLSVVFGFAAAPPAAICIFMAFVINITYSLKPVRISYRPLLVPFYLSIAYVAIPWATALSITKTPPTTNSILFVAGLCLLFMARISLKDFRDRAGDKANGKPTAVLRYGKQPVIIFAALSLTSGLGLVLYTLPASGLEKLFLAILGSFGFSMLLELYGKQKIEEELLTIGMGARFGNGLLFGMLGILLLNPTATGANERSVFLISLVSLFGWLWIDFHLRPQNYSYGGGGFRPAKGIVK